MTGLPTAVLAIVVLAAQAQPDRNNAPGFELATLQVRGAFGRPSEDWTIYSSWRETEAGRVPVHAIKRIDIEGKVTWAQSATCPALTPAIFYMEQISPPRITVPGADATRPPPQLIADGISYRLTVRLGQFAGGALAWDFSFAGNVNSPLASWYNRTSEQLAACWSETLSPGAE